jgi:hypothetical protein
MANEKGKNPETENSGSQEQLILNKQAESKDNKPNDSKKSPDPILTFFSEKEKKLGKPLTERTKSLFLHHYNKDKKKPLEEIWRSIYA